MKNNIREQLAENSKVDRGMVLRKLA